jgi:hypothetical protein
MREESRSNRVGKHREDPDRLRAVLFTAALLIPRTDLDHRTRLRVIGRVPPFDIHSKRGISQGLRAVYEGFGSEACGFRIPREKSLERARGLVERWTALGVFTVPFEITAASGAGLEDPPPLLFAWGDATLLIPASAAILNSRTPRRATPDDEWLKRTLAAFREAASRYDVIVSSHGTLAYSLVSRMACAGGQSLIVMCDEPLPHMRERGRLTEFLRTNAGLFPDKRTLMLSPFPPGRLPDGALRSRVRDELVAGSASVLFPVKIREGGNMQAVLKKGRLRGVPIDPLPPGSDDGLREDPNHAAASRTVPGPRSDALVLHPWPEAGACLAHYTRSCAGPWPGQSLAEYCQSLADRRPDAGHTAIDTLMRILEERLIRGSSRLTRGRVPLVSFTECSPGDLDALITWRPGLIRWSFEPYGLVVGKDLLTKLGARPVVYGTEGTFDDLPDEDRFRFQLREPGGKDWRIEKEWRLEGNLRLDEIPAEDMIVVVPTLEEARIAVDRIGCRVTLAGQRA